MSTYEVLGNLWIGHLTSGQQLLVRRGVSDLVARMELEEEEEENQLDGLDDEWRMRAAMARGQLNLPPIPNYQSEREVLEGYVQDCVKIKYDATRGLYVAAAEAIPEGAMIMTVRGILEQASMAQTLEEEAYTWSMPEGSAFALSQRDVGYANVLRYLNSSFYTRVSANCVIEWESVWEDRFCPGVGVLRAVRSIGRGYALLPEYYWPQEGAASS